MVDPVNPQKTAECSACIHAKVCAMKNDLAKVRELVAMRSIDMIPTMPFGSSFQITVQCDHYRYDTRPLGVPGIR